MKKLRRNKGITLVALIITIIVLLILAVVAIGAIQNDGIINHAKNARTEYETAQANEQGLLNNLLLEIEDSNSDAIARIGSTYYETLQAAIDAATGTEQVEIILLSNTTEAVIVETGKNIKLNLNGKMLTGKSQDDIKISVLTSGNYNAIQNLGTLNIINGNISVNGSLSMTIIANSGTLTMNSVTLSAKHTTTENTSDQVVPVVNYMGTANFTNCTINASADNPVYQVLGIYSVGANTTINGNSEINISGTMNCTAHEGAIMGIHSYYNDTTTISDATKITVSELSDPIGEYVPSSYVCGIDVYIGSTVNISGEVVIDSNPTGKSGYYSTVLVQNSSLFNMEGGSLINRFSGGYLVYNGGGTSTLKNVSGVTSDNVYGSVTIE